MRLTFPLVAAALLAAALAGALACRSKTDAPQWVAAMPGGTRFACSSELGWALEHKEIQGALARSPQVEQMLDLFLQKARIDPRRETGRLTFYLLDLPPRTAESRSLTAGSFLIQFSGFRDPHALQHAVTESFPPEGFLKIGGVDWPLFVVMDFQNGGSQLHLRVASDPAGNLWLGDLSALNALRQPSALPSSILSAAAWLSPHQKLQGALRPRGLLEHLRGQLPGECSTDLPMDLDIVMWGATPGTPGQPWMLEVVVGGTPDAIAQTAPWLQRLGAALDATRPQGRAPAQLLQERTRAGLRTTLDEVQVEGVLQRLGMPAFKLRGGKGQ